MEREFKVSEVEMIDIKCKTEDTITLLQLQQFQGNLKKRTDEDIKALAFSLKEDGLLMPFAVWVHDEKVSILDGHARCEALTRMATETPALLAQEFPVIQIKATDENEAKKYLLQITSSYGRVNKAGLATFVATIANYTSPAPIALALNPTVKAAAVSKTETDEVVLKLRVKKNMVHKIADLLNGVEGVTVL